MLNYKKTTNFTPSFFWGQFLTMAHILASRWRLFLVPLSFIWFASSCSVYHIPTADKPTYQQYAINSDIVSDPEIEAYYQPHKQQLEAEMNRVIGSSALDMARNRSMPETIIGNFFTHALLQEGRKHDPEIDFSFATKDGMRTDLPQGDITIGNIFELMPFENQLVILELSSDKVEELAQFIAATAGQPVSGIRLHISDGKATQITIGGQALEPGKTYKLLTYDYIANGGDHVRGLDQPIQRRDLPQKVREALIEHVQGLTTNGQQLNAVLDGRITIDQ